MARDLGPDAWSREGGGSGAGKGKGLEGELVVVGRGAQMHRDDDAAKHLEEGKHLHAIKDPNNLHGPREGGEESGEEESEEEVVDRYDVRNLVGGWSVRSAHTPFADQSSSVHRQDRHDEHDDLEKALEYERYRDLPPNEDESGRPGEPSGRGTDKESASSMPLVMHRDAFPEELRDLIPADMPSKAQKILLQTARILRRQGSASQMEIILRVKQAHNPNLSFIFPDDTLHPVFRWLVDSAEGKALFEDNLNEGDEERRQGGLETVSAADADAENSGCCSSEDDSVIVKTAKAVAKHGKLFEDLILSKESEDNARFSFLLPGDPRHAIYQRHLSDLLPRTEVKASTEPPAREALESFSKHQEKEDPSQRKRLEKVRRFFDEKRKAKLGEVQLVQASAMEQAQQDRRKRQRNIANLNDLFS